MLSAKKKLIFICGSLEPGRDGVGDYTRRLAGELSLLGYDAAIVALFDLDVTSVYDGEQDAGGVEIPVLRLPRNDSATIRFNLAKKWIDHYNPDWLSLQYVPFSFHPKGLPIFLDRHLERITSGRSWHIMFHELWVGMNERSNRKYKWWGWLQRQLIKSTINRLQPKLIHTNCQVYKIQLIKLGYHALHLPLFSNIPLIQPKTFNIPNNPHKDGIVFTIFGLLHPGAPVQQFVSEVSRLHQERGIIAVLRLIGRCGPEQDSWLAAWNSSGLIVEVLGELPSESITKALFSSTVGITTNPFALVEKSGTVAAMREHGLPVLSVAELWEMTELDRLVAPHGVYDYRADGFILENYLTHNRDISSESTATTIAKQFVKDISRLNLMTHN